MELFTKVAFAVTKPKVQLISFFLLRNFKKRSVGVEGIFSVQITPIMHVYAKINCYDYQRPVTCHEDYCS